MPQNISSISRTQDNVFAKMEEEFFALRMQQLPHINHEYALFCVVCKYLTQTKQTNCNSQYINYLMYQVQKLEQQQQQGQVCINQLLIVTQCFQTLLNTKSLSRTQQDAYNNLKLIYNSTYICAGAMDGDQLVITPDILDSQQLLFCYGDEKFFENISKNIIQKLETYQITTLFFNTDNSFVYNSEQFQNNLKMILQDQELFNKFKIVNQNSYDNQKIAIDRQLLEQFRYQHRMPMQMFALFRKLAQVQNVSLTYQDIAQQQIDCQQEFQSFTYIFIVDDHYCQFIFNTGFNRLICFDSLNIMQKFHNQNHYINDTIQQRRIQFLCQLIHYFSQKNMQDIVTMLNSWQDCWNNDYYKYVTVQNPSNDGYSCGYYCVYILSYLVKNREFFEKENPVVENDTNMTDIICLKIYLNIVNNIESNKSQSIHKYSIQKTNQINEHSQLLLNQQNNGNNTQQKSIFMNYLHNQIYDQLQQIIKIDMLKKHMIQSLQQQLELQSIQINQLYFQQNDKLHQLNRELQQYVRTGKQELVDEDQVNKTINQIKNLTKKQQESSKHLQLQEQDKNQLIQKLGSEDDMLAICQLVQKLGILKNLQITITNRGNFQILSKVSYNNSIADEIKEQYTKFYPNFLLSNLKYFKVIIKEETIMYSNIDADQNFIQDICNELLSLNLNNSVHLQLITNLLLYYIVSRINLCSTYDNIDYNMFTKQQSSHVFKYDETQVNRLNLKRLKLVEYDANEPASSISQQLEVNNSQYSAQSQRNDQDYVQEQSATSDAPVVKKKNSTTNPAQRAQIKSIANEERDKKKIKRISDQLENTVQKSYYGQVYKQFQNAATNMGWKKDHSLNYLLTNLLEKKQQFLKLEQQAKSLTLLYSQLTLQYPQDPQIIQNKQNFDKMLKAIQQNINSITQTETVVQQNQNLDILPQACSLIINDIQEQIHKAGEKIKKYIDQATPKSQLIANQIDNVYDAFEE